MTITLVLLPPYDANLTVCHTPSPFETSYDIWTPASGHLPFKALTCWLAQLESLAVYLPCRTVFTFFSACEKFFIQFQNETLLLIANKHVLLGREHFDAHCFRIRPSRDSLSFSKERRSSTHAKQIRYENFNIFS